MKQFFAFLHRMWLKLGEILGWLWTRILLTMIFFVVLGPIALMMKFFNQNPLKFHFRANSYWLVKRQKNLAESDYYHQF